MMRILNSLSYYRPHYSGLTVYTERLARSLAARGHQLTVLTSRYDPKLPALERLDGIEVRRVGVAFKVSKGPVMPTFPYWGFHLIRKHDLLHLHVPQLDAAPLALIGRLLGKPVVLTYHCDLRLPLSPVNWLANQVSHLANHISMRGANVIVTNTRDYAESSAFLRHFLHKIVVIPPPIEIEAVDQKIVDRARVRWGVLDESPVIGMAARLATEKGAEILARAFPKILEVHPRARVLYAGQYQDVIGEEAYARRLEPLLAPMGDQWKFLGVLPKEEWSAFFSVCDVTVLPSLNSTESFGMVQVESMFCGTPVVASDLPGVRQPTLSTGMGLVFPPGDVDALADRILQVLANPEAFSQNSDTAIAQYGSERVGEQYERLFEKLLAGDDIDREI